MTKKIASIFGSARTPEGTAAWRQAYELGRRLAQAGWIVANGGYDGTMAAVSQGARDAGGYVIGVTCAAFDPLPPNPWLSEERKMPTLIARLEAITSLGDAFIALPGGIGTLTEVTLVWSLLQTGSLSPRPFVLVGAPWAGLVDAFKRYTEMGDSILALAQLAADVEEAISLLK
ncbi:MAG TPA: LOG family protein [Caldilineae bacterium]|nr:LOG family protein [Caldilineae bacterium]